MYDFAGELRAVNLSKGSFRFAPVLYLPAALAAIDQMPHTTYDEIVDKYVEMNVAHPFREGNGRSGCIWLDAMLRKTVDMAVDWSLADREDYLLAMEQSPIRSTEIKKLLEGALTTDIDNRQVFMRGIDASYRYEGYAEYTMNQIEAEAARS